MKRALPLAALLAAACAREEASPAPVELTEAPTIVRPPEVTAPVTVRPPAIEEGAIEEVAVPGDLPVYVIRSAAPSRRTRAVFLTGSCTTPLDYIRAFRRAAAQHGGLVALQADQPCAEPGQRRWSADSAATSKRIEAALKAVGVEETEDLTLIGYSQGAERAEWIANRYPTKYTRFLLLASPIVPSATRLANARAVVTMAGRGDVRENMSDGARALKRAAIPATYMEIASHTHGELDAAADGSVARALDWLDENARPRRATARATP
jgi:predicted esterase